MFLIISKDKEDVRRHLSRIPPNFSRITFDPETFTVDAFLQEVETPPFLSSGKQVILHEIDALSKEQLEALIAYLEKPSPWVSLYLTAQYLPPQSKVVKLVEKSGEVTHFKEEKPWEKENRLAEWLIQEAKGEGVQLSAQAASVLVKAVDHQMLQCELEKLICYVGERKKITLDDIALISSPVHHETLWQLGDAIFAKEVAGALKIGGVLLDEAMTIFPLLAHVRSQFTNGIEILEAAGPSAIQKKFPYLKGSLLEKKMGILKKYGRERLYRGLLSIFEAEIEAKSNKNPSLVLELLIVNLTL